jgi:hypothetical protein
MILASTVIAEYEEQVASFFRRAKSKAEGEAALAAHSALLMAALPELLSTIRESPAYAGVAFYGRLKAVDLPLIKRLVANNATAESAITQIRAAKALQVSASAKKGWDFLLGCDVEALWSAIHLTLCRPKPVKAEKMPHPDENSDGDDYFQSDGKSDDDGDDDEDSNEEGCDDDDNR